MGKGKGGEGGGVLLFLALSCSQQIPITSFGVLQRCCLLLHRTFKAFEAVRNEAQAMVGKVADAALQLHRYTRLQR